MLRGGLGRDCRVEEVLSRRGLVVVVVYDGRILV
jgi:hypothetical protein